MITHRVLSLDGGGIRGLITTILLERLLAARPDLLSKVDLIAGTSTGGIIALGLAHGLSPTTLRELYEKRGPAIFDDSWWDDVKDIGGLSGADYDNTNLRKELNRVFGGTRLRQLRKRVLISTFDLDNESPNVNERTWKAKFFHNYPGPDSDGDALAVSVALYTSAAPTYFPTVDGYIDGGVVANNPAMAALAQTQDSRITSHPPKLDEIALLSIGTGRTLSYIKGANLDWGLGQWAKPLVNILTDGVTGVVDYQCRQILGPNYCRLSPLLPATPKIQLDGVKHIPQMIALAGKEDIASVTTWLRSHW